MAADGTGASALFPGLPSAADTPAAPPAADRLGASSIYGPGPNAGLDVARATMRGGMAEPGGAQPSEPGKPPPADWLGELSNRGEEKAAPERTPAAGAGTLDLRALKLDDTPLAREFSETASELGIDQTQASKLVPLYQKALTENSVAYWTKQEGDWAKASRAQFGPRLDTMVATVQPLLADNTLTTKGFRDLLGQFGLGSNPHVVETLSRWGAAIRAGRRR